jgi:hypothetical protein
VRRRSLLLGFVSLMACGPSDDAPPPDGSSDGATDASTTVRTPPAPPDFSTCPEGFHEREVLGVTVCDPWPDTGRQTCPAWEVHLPGEPGCRPIGTPCPETGRFATDLPDDARIFYVDPEAPPGGDGSEGAPYDSLDLAMRDAGSGQIIALAAGTYDEAPRLREGVTLWGACVAETHLAPTTTSGFVGAVSSNGEATVKNLRIGGARSGAGVLDAGETLTLDSLWIEETGNYGIVASNGGRITIRDSHLGTPDEVPGLSAQTILAQNGGRVDLERVEIAGARSGCITSEDAGSVVTLSRVSARNSLGLSGTGERGRGAYSQSGGRVDVSESIFDDMGEVGALAKGDGSVVALEDVWIVDTRAQPDGLFGRGASAQDGGALSMSRVVVDGARESGIIALQAAQLDVTDVIVRNVRQSPSDERFGMGVVVTDGPFTLRRALVDDVLSAGISIEGSAAAGMIEDVTVSNVGSESGRGFFGRGLNVFTGASATVARVVVDRVRDVGVFLGSGQLDADDLVVRSVDAQACAATTCADSPAGIGVGAYDGSIATIERFVISDNALAGVQLVASEADLTDGEVANNPIGANIQIDGYDPSRLSTRVEYRDNGVNLDAQSLPVPTLPDQPTEGS